VRAIASFASGLVLALGLGVSGMTKPAKVIGFLDVAGAWDPSLSLVMGFAVLVSLVAFAVVPRRRAPVLAPAFELPTEKRVDRPLVVGAIVFGVGWGLSGVCPGPAIVALATLTPASLVFFGSMLVGTLAFRAPGLARAARRDSAVDATPAE
jgi:uncharacterized membrane protein YedE/YeeE